jgi:hypothetical protein
MELFASSRSKKENSKEEEEEGERKTHAKKGEEVSDAEGGMEGGRGSSKEHPRTGGGWEGKQKGRFCLG